MLVPLCSWNWPSIQYERETSILTLACDSLFSCLPRSLSWTPADQVYNFYFWWTGDISSKQNPFCSFIYLTLGRLQQKFLKYVLNAGKSIEPTCEEILTDQGTKFSLMLLSEVACNRRRFPYKPCQMQCKHHHRRGGKDCWLTHELHVHCLHLLERD